MKSVLFLLLTFSVIIAGGMGGCQTDDLTDPGTDTRDKFLGSWKVVDLAARINYSVTISKNPSNSAEVRLVNFADDGGVAIGLVVGSTIVIDQQQIGETFTAEGDGKYINASKLEFTFTLSDGIDIQHRTAIYTK